MIKWYRVQGMMFGTALFLLQPMASAGLLFNYGQLATKDLDQMNAIAQQKIRESKHEAGDKTIALKEGVQAVFSRPDDDGTIEKVITPLKTALDEYDAWETTLKKLTNEAVGALKNPKAFQPVIQVTYEVFLENVVEQLKPHADNTFEKNLLTQIRDANIALTKDALHERLKRTMTEAKSPSLMAAQVLKEAKEKPTPTPEVPDSLAVKEPATPEKNAKERGKDAGKNTSPELTDPTKDMKELNKAPSPSN